MNKKNIIDGLPASYDFNYVIKTQKRCVFCHSLISMEEIDLSLVACTEGFEFIHKPCAEREEFEIVYSKNTDTSSMIRLVKKQNIEQDEAPSI